MKRLSKEEMKKVIGGVMDSGHRCVLYCCPSSGGDCTGPLYTQQMACQTNEDCQAWGVGNGAACSSGYYVAALCKG